MAFSAFEYLKQGKYEFVFSLTPYYVNDLVNDVRNSKNKKEIIDGFISDAKNVLPHFCLDIIYDMEDYKDDVFELLEDKEIFDYFVSSISKMSKILYTTSWGKTFIFSKFDDIVEINNEFLQTILNYAFFDFDVNIEFVKKISMTSNLHVRYQIIKFIIINHLDKFKLIYDDIISALTYSDNATIIMDKIDVSDLAIAIYNSELDKNEWIKIKEFVLTNYKNNCLASSLLNSKENNEQSKREFILDADRFFDTSLDYKIEIYKKYSEYISKELLESYIKYFKYFKINNELDRRLNHIIMYELYEELKCYIDKYLSLSKTDDYRFLGRGSTASTYKIGDYVFKLNNRKWSYEECICPNLYLIIKNLEEHYIRNQEGHVEAGIEVQKYLSRNDKITIEHVKKFERDLACLGYYVDDKLINGNNGNNCMLLDSYKDADCEEPEKLPQQFKDFPLVLIDRDLVFKTEDRNVKSLLRYRY